MTFCIQEVLIPSMTLALPQHVPVASMAKEAIGDGDMLRRALLTKKKK